MTDPQPRPARSTDADELTRLHVEVGLGTPVNPAWRTTHRDSLARRLAAADPHLVAYVLDAPDAPGLAAGAVAFLQHGLPRPDARAGLTGHLASVTTAPPYRRRGYARAVTTAAVQHMTAHGCSHITLHASTTAAPLYASLGFEPVTNAMVIRTRSSSAA